MPPNSPIVTIPAYTSEPSSPRYPFPIDNDSSIFIVAAGIIPWSMLISRLVVDKREKISTSFLDGC